MKTEALKEKEIRAKYKNVSEKNKDITCVQDTQIRTRTNKTKNKTSKDGDKNNSTNDNKETDGEQGEEELPATGIKT